MSVHYKKINDQVYADSSYGYWECPECNSEFAGGGPAVHKKGCPLSGYKSLTYYFTDVEEKRWGEKVLEQGYAAHLPLSPITLSNYFLSCAIASGELSPENVISITTEYVKSIDEQYLPGILEKLNSLIDSAIA